MKVSNRRPRIAIFHCGFIYTGGGERIVLEEIEGLKKRGYQVDCFVPSYDASLSYPDIIKKYKIKTFLPQLPKVLPLRFAIKMLATCILAPFLALGFRKYDLILGANQPGAYMAWVIAKILGKPYVVYLSQPNRVLYPRDHEDWQTIHDYYLLNNLINRFFYKLVAYLDKKSITEGKELFINGSFIAKEIVNIYQPKSWINCPGGAKVVGRKDLDIDRFSGSVEVNGHTPSKPYVLYTSRHISWKRFDWAIEVMSIVIKKYSNIRLVIPGEETPVTEVLRKKAQELGITDRVIFTGAITQKALWDLYKNAAVYLFTSPKEDLGIVVEEAQASGIPVVAWNSGGPTVTVVNGKTGFLISPFNKEKMAEKVIYLLNNPKLVKNMGKSGWLNIKNNFSWENHIMILDSFIKKYV